MQKILVFFFAGNSQISQSQINKKGYNKKYFLLNLKLVCKAIYVVV